MNKCSGLPTISGFTRLCPISWWCYSYGGQRALQRYQRYCHLLGWWKVLVSYSCFFGFHLILDQTPRAKIMCIRLLLRRRLYSGDLSDQTTRDVIEHPTTIGGCFEETPCNVSRPRPALFWCRLRRILRPNIIYTPSDIGKYARKWNENEFIYFLSFADIKHSSFFAWFFPSLCPCSATRRFKSRVWPFHFVNTFTARSVEYDICENMADCRAHQRNILVWLHHSTMWCRCPSWRPLRHF